MLLEDFQASILQVGLLQYCYIFITILW